MGILDFLFGPNIEKMKENKDVEGLIKALASQNKLEIRIKAAKALLQIAETPAVRINVVKQLSEIEDIKAVELLKIALKDETPEVCNAASAALEKITKIMEEEELKKVKKVINQLIQRVKNSTTADEVMHVLEEKASKPKAVEEILPVIITKLASLRLVFGQNGLMLLCTDKKENPGSYDGLGLIKRCGISSATVAVTCLAHNLKNLPFDTITKVSVGINNLIDFGADGTEALPALNECLELMEKYLKSDISKQVEEQLRFTARSSGLNVQITPEIINATKTMKITAVGEAIEQIKSAINKTETKQKRDTKSSTSWLNLEGSRFPLFNKGESFFDKCNSSGQSAIIFPFNALSSIFKRGLTSKTIDGDIRLLCAKCLVDMPMSFKFALIGMPTENMIVFGNIPSNTFDSAKSATCPYCASSQGILLWDNPNYGEITEQDMKALQDLWRFRCQMWWEQNKLSEGKCDSCNCDMKPQEGYHLGSRVVCEKCVMVYTNSEALTELKKKPTYFGMSELRRAQNFKAGLWRLEPGKIMIDTQSVPTAKGQDSMCSGKICPSCKRNCSHTEIFCDDCGTKH